jgi:FADH2 O2-dependent halogenase
VGAGFEGGLLGLILASQGAKVLIIEAGTHPRFALGESTVRHTFRMMKILGERWQIPEIKNKFSSGEQVHKFVTSNCGEKRNFGFVYHREGQHQNPEEANQLVIPPFREGFEAHLYRQDIDAFLTYSAVHYGATVKYKTMINAVDIDAQGVTVKTVQGDTFKARFIADGSGTTAVVGRLLGLREDPPRFRLKSRCLFTHMIDVKPYDDLSLPRGVPRMKERWYNGTCHHVFDGGWLWVIPFDNREGSTNPVVSVGLSYDLNKYPKPADMTPEEEWNDFLSRFPSIYEQFKDAKVTRDWVSSGRLQTSCTQAVGDRFCLLAAAYGSGFIDALYSRGLANSIEVVSALAPRLLKALKDDDFSRDRFEYIQTLQDNNIANNDKMVSSSYVAFRDYDLWNAWLRIWAMGVGLGDLRLASIYRRYLHTHEESILPDNEEPMGLFYSNHLGFKALFDQAVAEVAEVEAGTLSSKEAARRIFALVGKADFSPPANKLGDPAHRCINQGAPGTLLRTLGWLATSAPPDIRNHTLTALFGPRGTRAMPAAPKPATSTSR